jgi:perosamine synthetase
MEPALTESDTRAVSEYMSSGAWLTEFDRTREFERMLCELTGARFCFAAPSGTLALFLALAACGVRPGDEVIVPDLTMAASATAVILAGADVVFADVDATTFCLDFEDAFRKMSPRTKAVMFVSLNGRSPAGLRPFIEECRRRNIRVVEDAAQSLGSFHGGRHLGTLGDCGCLSFSSQKIVTTGQGGAVITDDEEIFESMRLLRDFGRAEGGSDHYLRVGWNLKFTDLQAVIGIEQMRRLPESIERKRGIARHYSRLLGGIDGIVVPATDLENVTPWFIDVLVEPEQKPALIAHLRSDGIGSRPLYPPLHAEPAFAHTGSYPVATDISRRGLWLPSSLRLENADVERVCESIRRFFSR